MAVHQWLRDALADKGLEEKYLAKRLGVNASQVSRFINFGTPRLKWEEAVVISSMLGIDMNELQGKIAATRKPTRKVARLPDVPAPVVEAPAEPAPAVEATVNGAKCDDTVQALNQLRTAVDQARRLLPAGCKISISIDYPGLSNDGGY
jgi:hypothetical protein